MILNYPAHTLLLLLLGLLVLGFTSHATGTFDWGRILFAAISLMLMCGTLLACLQR
jgi:hypothetical protein